MKDINIFISGNEFMKKFTEMMVDKSITPILSSSNNFRSDVRELILSQLKTISSPAVQDYVPLAVELLNQCDIPEELYKDHPPTTDYSLSEQCEQIIGGMAMAAPSSFNVPEDKEDELRSMVSLGMLQNIINTYVFVIEEDLLAQRLIK